MDAQVYQSSSMSHVTSIRMVIHGDLAVSFPEAHAKEQEHYVQSTRQQQAAPIPAGKLIKFLLSGVPAFLVAVPLNILLVEKLHLYKPIAYALVLSVQITINFLLIRFFVFCTSKTSRSWLEQFWGIGFGSLSFRILEWAIYTLAVQVFGIYYVIVQCANVLIFLIPKFLYVRWVMEK